MGRVLKISDLSKKDYSLETGILRVKDSVFNITSNIGDGSKADFNESNPLLYWTAPANPKKGAVAHVLFNDGLAYYTYDGILWSLNFFYASSSYITTGPLVYKALVSQTGTNTPTLLLLSNNTGLNINPNGYTNAGNYLFSLSGIVDRDKTTITLGRGLNPGITAFYNVNLEFNNSQIRIQTGYLTIDGSSILPVNANNYLLNNLLTIEVYP